MPSYFLIFPWFFTPNSQMFTPISFLHLFFSFLFFSFLFITRVQSYAGLLKQFSVSSTCAVQSRKGMKNEVKKKIKDFCAGVRETILERNLLSRYQTRTWFPVRILFLKGTGWTISTDYTWVRSRNHNCNPTINPSTHVKNESLHLIYYESAQIWEYN